VLWKYLTASWRTMRSQSLFDMCGCGLSIAGANLEVDVPWKYLNFFLEDDAKLATIGREYAAGRMFTGDVKKELIQVSLAFEGVPIG